MIELTTSNWIAVIGTLVGLGGIVYGAYERRRSERRARDAEQARQPRPELTFKEIKQHYRPPDPGSPLVQIAVCFYVVNNGGTAAHNVACDVSLDPEALEPDEMHGPNAPFQRSQMLPGAREPHAIHAGIVRPGSTDARYSCSFAEGKTEGRVSFDVPDLPA